MHKPTFSFYSASTEIWQTGMFLIVKIMTLDSSMCNLLLGFADFYFIYIFTVIELNYCILGEKNIFLNK